MAQVAADPKSAPLSDDLKEFALSLPPTVFPKNFFCALCGQLAVDSWKLLCCNKVICSSCQANLQFPTTCPSCDHSPLEAGSCVPNKALRNTMRVWLEKRKKKEGAKAAPQAPTTPVDAVPASAGGMSVGDTQENPVEGTEEKSKVEAGSVDQAPVAVSDALDPVEGAASTSAKPKEDVVSPQTETDRRGSVASQIVMKNVEPEASNGTTDQSAMMSPNSSSMGNNNNNPMMNGMHGQMGFGFPNQAGFNNGMNWNGMSQMNGMPNMMAGGGWNGMNPMEFNMNGMPNGMYGNMGGNMGMGVGMNDMSAMNMMNYGGGYGNGWNGMGAGFGNGNGNFNGHNQMGGYNQSGAYPEMMNQFPKNNFPNQNRFHVNQGGVLPQRQNRNGSYGGFGPGFQNANSRPGSRSGPAHNRDSQLPEGSANSVPDAKAEEEQQNAPAEQTGEGKEAIGGPQESTNAQNVQKPSTSGDLSKDAADTVNQIDMENQATQGAGLNQIQTVESVDSNMDGYNQSMVGNNMQQDVSYPQSIMNQAQMNSSFDPNMNMGYNSSNNNYGPRGGFNNGAYGAATVLTGQPSEPVGMGVAGAPTGPRAMREGRPNTGFSSRMNNIRYNPPPKSTPVQTAAPASPPPKDKSRSPAQGQAQGAKKRSPSRSRSRSKVKDDDRDNHRSRSYSADADLRREARGRSPASSNDEEYEHRHERRHHRSSRHDDRDDDSDDRRRDDRESRGDRTRDASTDSKHRSSRRDKEKYRSSRSHRDRSREHRRRHRSRSPVERDKYDNDDAYRNGERESDGSSRRKYRSSDKEKHRDRDRSRDKDRDRDRKDRKDRKDRERDREYEYEREKERSREKDKDRRRRRDREAEEEDERDYDDDTYRSSRRSRKENEREREKEKAAKTEREEDVISQMMKKRPVSPPLNAPTGPSANGFSIKGRSKNIVMPPPIQPPTGPRAFQPPKGPAADRNRDRGESRDHHRKSSISSVRSGPVTPTGPATPVVQDHYAAERERNARERDSREKVDQGHRETANKSLHSRIHSSSRPSLSTKRSRDDMEDTERSEISHNDIPRGPKADMKVPTGPASHRDKRRKSGVIGDDNIANLFTAGLRKNAKARRGGVRTEGDVEREMERVERERDRR